MQDRNELISVGRISGTHGIKGGLRVRTYSGNRETLDATGVVTLRSPDGALTREYRLLEVKNHGGAFIIRLDGYDDINQVASLVGSELCLRRTQFPEPDDDEYYWCDLIGLTVVTAEGVTLGTLAEIFETGSNDIYVVRNGTQEYLLPAIAPVISSIDLDAGTMTVTPLDGLLDL